MAAVGYDPPMQDKDRERRRQRRLEKTKKKRANVSRPGLGGPVQAQDASKGKAWPVGDCWASIGWEEDGATVDLVFSRVKADGTAVIAVFEVDRSGPGLVSARARGGLRREHVAGECGRISERTGRAMVEVGPGLIAAMVDEAAEEGTNPLPPGYADAAELLEGVPRAHVGTPFGSGDAPEAPKPEGLFGRLVRTITGG